MYAGVPSDQPNLRERSGERGSNSVPSYGEHMPLPGHTLQRVRPAILELDAGAGHQILHGPRYQDLVRVGQGGYACPDVDRDAPDLVSHELDLPRVDPCPNLQPDRVDRVDDRPGATDRTGRAVEGRQEPVARGVDLHTAERAELLTEQSVVPFEQLPPRPIADGARRVGGPDDVGEQD